jgi:protein ImuB
MVAIEAQTEHGESLVRHWRHDGSLTAAALAERTRWQLDGWIGADGAETSGPTAGVTLLRLTAEEVRPDRGKQLGFWGGVAESDDQAARAFARVQGLLGPEAVVTAVLCGGRGFAEQARLVPWGDCREPPRGSDSRRRRVVRGPSAETPPWPGRVGGPAPAVVYATGAPRGDGPLSDSPAQVAAEVLGPDGLPVEVNGRGLLSAVPAGVSIAGGPVRRVTGWAGPWPIEERWWDGGGRRRARLQVLLENGDAHLLSREQGNWAVEASYG